jgi:hypothetical protein
MSLLAALFLPIMPPKNYSIVDRNFESEYEEMKKQYLKNQNQNGNDGSREAKLNMPMAWTFR